MEGTSSTAAIRPGDAGSHELIASINIAAIMQTNTHALAAAYKTVAPMWHQRELLLGGSR